MAASGPVSVTLEQLRQGSVAFSVLEQAFGSKSLGIIIVRDLPEKFADLRRRLLSYSSYLANLPPAELEKLECPQSKWLIGWSCGKETLKDGRYDTLKGSFYANPAGNATLQTKAIHLYPNLPEYTASNVWPDQHVLPGFKETFYELCDLIISTAVLVAQACDRYAEANIPDYQPGYLEHVVKSSISTKARLLHYFPLSASTGDTDGVDDKDDDWCGTHIDHACLTGLTSAMFTDEKAYPPTALASTSSLSPIPELDRSPDPEAGLYIHSRSGDVVKVDIPRDCLAFQTGEALEVITRGKFRAVPHFVRGARTGGAARNTLAVFTQPNLWDMVDGDRDFARFAKEIVERNH